MRTHKPNISLIVNLAIAMQKSELTRAQKQKVAALYGITEFTVYRYIRNVNDATFIDLHSL